MFERLRKLGYDVLTLHHAEAILTHDMPDAVRELEEALNSVRLPVEELVRGGGGESKITQRLRGSLAELGWKKHRFEIRKIVDGVERESASHEIDHVRRFPGGTIALEIEWNNKDPFFDRDLDNFKRLHADGAVSLGVVVTRGASLQEALRPVIAEFAKRSAMSRLADLSKYYQPTSRQLAMIERAIAAKGSFHEGWSEAFVSDKFGEATTHWRKLEERVGRGVGNPCPLLLLGIPGKIVQF